MAMEPQQANSMSKMDGTDQAANYSLAILDLYIYFSYVKNMMKNVATKSDLALVKMELTITNYVLQ